MNQLQALKEGDYEVPGWLFTGEENKSESFKEQSHKIRKSIKYVFEVGLPSNKNQPKNMPLLIKTHLSMSQYETTNSVDDKVESFIARMVSKVPEVEYILLSKTDNYYEIWTVINRLDRKVREDIYDIEFFVLKSLNGLYFDFHVLCRNDRNINEMFSSRIKTIFRRKS
ncbi:MAG: hypothetical protein ABIG94_07005 [Pseudomonadota bacterium]